MAEGLTRDQVSTEALNILKSLRENARSGRSNKLADVKSTFEHAVSLEFDNYFFFLRKYHFIAMDREACLQLTGEGEKVLDGDRRERFQDVVIEYFGGRIGAAEPPPIPRNEAVAKEETIIQGVLEEVPASEPGDRVSYSLEPDTAPRAASLPPPPPTGAQLPTSRGAEKSRSRAAPPRAEKELDVPPPVQSAPAPTHSSRPQRNEPEARGGAEGRGGQEIDLRYVKYDAMGQGPLGTVYRGRHTALGLDVCVKELKDIFGYFTFLQRGEVIKRLKRELCSQALVRHPSVVAILDQNCDVARPYFVLELCSGGNLRQRLDQSEGKPLPIDAAIRLFLQLCYGLRAAHQQNLTHANLKPENVLFDHYGNAKLGDFGMSRVIEVDAARGMPQVFVGTGGMGYMSPEQLARSNKDVGPGSDVYSLGIVLYEVLTGQLPGRRSPLPSSVNPEVPKELDPIFDKMTQDRRTERYPDLDAVLADFYTAFEKGPYLHRGDLILSSEGVAPAPAQSDASS